MRGGKRPNSGRKSKAEEDKLIQKLNPLNEIAFKKLKKGIERGEFNFIKLYFQYRYGLPKQQNDINLTTNQEVPLFNINFENTTKNEQN